MKLTNDCKNQWYDQSIDIETVLNQIHPVPSDEVSETRDDLEHLELAKGEKDEESKKSKDESARREETGSPSRRTSSSENARAKTRHEWTHKCPLIPKMTPKVRV
ncbi:hypothetical protein TNCV_1756221 [Trichonephila clavipes]|nr:hypothetical protein TNCV_1756221 [Trichonephila clavipes]